jgi:hypothetical protein
VELVFRELEHMWSVVIFRGAERVARRNRIGLKAVVHAWRRARGTRAAGMCPWMNSGAR